MAPVEDRPWWADEVVIDHSKSPVRVYIDGVEIGGVVKYDIRVARVADEWPRVVLEVALAPKYHVEVKW